LTPAQQAPCTEPLPARPLTGLRSGLAGLPGSSSRLGPQLSQNVRTGPRGASKEGGGAIFSGFPLQDLLAKGRGEACAAPLVFSGRLKLPKKKKKTKNKTSARTAAKICS